MQRRDLTSLLVLAATMAAAVILFGGAARWAAVALAFVAVAAVGVQLTSRRTASHPGPVLMVVTIATALTAIQLLPLPTMIAEIVAPAKLALVTDHAAAFDEPTPTWTVASWDAPATLVELAKLAGYLAVAWIATRLAAQRRARPWLAAIVVGAAVLMMAIAAVHYLLGATRVYGWFDLPAGVRLLGPVINANHVASLAGLASPLAAGLGLSWSGRRRAAALLATLVLAASTLLTGSRGGVLALGAGALVTVMLLVAQRRAGPVDERRTPLSITLPVISIAICAVTLIGYLSAREVVTELDATRLDEIHEPHSKFQVWTQATDLIPENRWLGVGKGGFEGAYQRIAVVGDVSYSHAENSYLQAMLDWGVPGAMALLMALTLLGRTAVRQWRAGPLDAGALGALTVIAVHELVDFSLELPLIAMATILLVSIVVPARLGTGGDRRRPVPRRIIHIRAGLVAAGLVVIALAASPLGRPASADRAQARSLVAARKALRRHPTDGLAAGAAAQALLAARDPRSVKVINRALYLRPHTAGLHRLAARLLVRLERPRQAQVEYAAALVWSYGADAGTVIDEILAVFPDPGEAGRALPLDPRHTWRLHALLIERRRPEVALAFTARVVALRPDSVHAQTEHARAALSTGRYDLALPAATAAHLLDPTAQTAFLLARAQAGTGDADGAILTLRGAPLTANLQFRSDVVVTLANLLRERGDLAAARAALVDGVASVAASPSHEASLRLHLATVEEALGNTHQARWERDRAAALLQEQSP